MNYRLSVLEQPEPCRPLPRYLASVKYQEEAVMPVLVMWAIPAVVVIGGVGYWLVHMH
jgi:hypothetical protein